MGRETETLLAALHSQREHVLGILDGMDDEQLRQPVLPSGWNCLGLVRHLALDVERFWFQGVVSGDEAVWTDLGGDSAWQVPEGLDAKAVTEAYRAAAARSDAVLAGTPLDQPPARWPDFFGECWLADVHAVAVHVLTETACHAGHLDAARELLDGRQWLVLS